MKKLLFIAVLCFFGAQVFAQDKTKDFTPDTLAEISHLSQYSYQWCPKEYKDFLTNVAEIDTRSCDLSAYDLTNLPSQTLQKLTFDDKTIWPAKMPKWLNIKKIYQTGKTPGLNIKKLHQQGITGKGVNIAIIDQALSPHQEYNENIAFYKNFEKYASTGDMHGAAVASIAVGKKVGVAPEAKLYYVSANFSDYYKNDEPFNAYIYTQAIEYLLELNKTLPKEDKIFAIAMSRGFNETDYGRKEFLNALEKAKEQNILVLTTNDVSTVSRPCYCANPDKISSYTKPALWFDEKDVSNYSLINDICVPTDFRIIASPTGENDYVAYSNGGLSWAVPYLAGIAALAKQVNPDLTPQEFMYIAHKTAQNVEVKKGNSSAKAKYFINPQALIKELQNRKKSTKNKESRSKELEKLLKFCLKTKN